MSAISLDRAQIHQLEVNPIGIPVLLILDHRRASTQPLEQSAQLADLGGTVARDRATSERTNTSTDPAVRHR